MILSIIIPAYNEKDTIEQSVQSVLNVNFSYPYEVIIVDDGSTDGTTGILKNFIAATTTGLDPVVTVVKVVFKDKNQGKGAALRCGFEKAAGDIIAVHDADLEYDPRDLPQLIQPILNRQKIIRVNPRTNQRESAPVKVVYGSRFLKHHTPGYLFYYVGNRLVAFLFRLIYRATLTDPYTCYKVFARDILNKVNLTSNGFEIEAEFTAKVLRAGYKILELPISYKWRTIEQGKKINWRDGIKAVWTLFKYRFIIF